MPKRVRQLGYRCIEFPMRSPQLHSAIEQVYAEFRGPKPRAIEGCPCCTDPTEVCVLLAKPLRDLTSRELSNYGASLFLTMGDKQDFNYFLPRLLDVATTEDWWPSPQVLLGKLELVHWKRWPERQQAAVKRVVDIWYADCLDADRLDGADIDALLCGIGAAGLPLVEYLNVLTNRPDELQAFFDIHAHAFFKKKRLGDGFWKDFPNAEQAVLNFFNSNVVREKLGLNSDP